MYCRRMFHLRFRCFRSNFRPDKTFIDPETFLTPATIRSDNNYVYYYHYRLIVELLLSRAAAWSADN